VTINDSNDTYALGYTNPVGLPEATYVGETKDGERFTVEDDLSAFAERSEHRANAEIGQRLADARKFLRLRQDCAASRLCVTRQVISAIETGTRPLKATELAVLCNLYRVTPDVILDVKRFGAS
jgi:DNA-binding XRE family transcriptional regulator